MPDVLPLPLWAGRTVALVGLVLVALSLRTAVAVISPIAAQIGVDVPLTEVSLGVIGSLPPVAFALSGLFGAALAKRMGLERLLLISIVAMVAGHAVRGAASSYAMLFGGSIIVFAGIGIGNVLAPALVKRYFPDRIALMTTLYATSIAIGATVPAIIASPIANSAGWRLSLGLWSAVAALSLAPWIAVLMQNRRRRAADSRDELPEIPAALVGRIWHSRTAWRLAAIFALSSSHVYAMFSLLPSILIDSAGTSPATAGVLLGVYAFAGMPSAVIVPILVVRMRHPGVLMQVGIGCFVLGYAGLLLLPGIATLLWVVLAGFGSLVFPGVLVLLNLRSRTAAGSVALSGFVQGAGYAVGALGPLLLGVLHAVSGGWQLPLMVLIVTALACVVPASKIGRHTYVEDDISRR